MCRYRLWMCCYRPLDGSIQMTGCAQYFGRNCCSYLKKSFVQNKTNRLYQGIWLTLVRSYVIFVNPLFKANMSYAEQLLFLSRAIFWAFSDTSKLFVKWKLTNKCSAVNYELWRCKNLNSRATQYYRQFPSSAPSFKSSLAWRLS